MGALSIPPDGHWRRLTNGGVVEADWCWRCNERPIRLTQDPMVRDAIGVCASCASQRRGRCAAAAFSDLPLHPRKELHQ